MAKATTLVITAGRKASENYSTREVAYTISLELAEGENPKQVLEVWTERLQAAVDQALGDAGSPRSFQGTAGKRNA